MVKFNNNDFNLYLIKKESRLENVKTKHEYKIYGVKKEAGNPLIWLEFPDTSFFWQDSNILYNFFLFNKISLEKDSSSSIVKIGLRHDLREHVVLSACIVQTIVYTFEKRLILSEDYLIPGLSKIGLIEEKKKNLSKNELVVDDVPF